MGAGVLADGVVGDGVLAEGVVGLLVRGPVRGVLEVESAVVCGASGFSGFPTGSDGRVLERDVPSDRSTVGPDELVDCGD